MLGTFQKKKQHQLICWANNNPTEVTCLKSLEPSSCHKLLSELLLRNSCHLVTYQTLQRRLIKAPSTKYLLNRTVRLLLVLIASERFDGNNLCNNNSYKAASTLELLKRTRIPLYQEVFYIAYKPSASQ